jgi:hypothetical protein
MNLRVTERVGNFLTSWVTVNFSRWTLLCGIGWLVHKMYFWTGNT